MKALIIVGSRNPQGRTAQAAQALTEGWTAAGGEADWAFLPQGNIQCCRQCGDNGWGPCATGDACAIADDLPVLLERLRTADAVVFATPVYFADLAESMRAFLDRLRRMCWQGPSKAYTQGKPAVGIAVAGGGGGGGAPRCVANLEPAVAQCGFDLVDLVPARRHNLEHKREVLRLTGRWLAGYIAGKRVG